MGVKLPEMNVAVLVWLSCMYVVYNYNMTLAMYTKACTKSADFLCSSGR